MSEDLKSCPNCGNHYGCSCSGGSAKQTASDGKTVCSKCITTYEQALAELRKAAIQNAANKVTGRIN